MAGLTLRTGVPRTFGAMAPLRRFEINQYAESGSSDFYDGAGTFLTNIVTGIGQGSTDAQRLGDRLEVKSIRLFGYIFNHLGTTANQLSNFKLVVFQYFGDTSASPPAASTMLLSSSANAGTTYGTWSVYNIDRVYQYRVLYESRIITTVGSGGVAVSGSAGGPGITRAFDFKVPLRNMDRFITYYSGGANGLNHLYFMALSDQSTIATNPTIFWSSVIRYVG